MAASLLTADAPAPSVGLAELRQRVRQLERSGRLRLRANAWAQPDYAALPDAALPDDDRLRHGGADDGGADNGSEMDAPWRISTGWPQLDRLLPGGGLSRAALCEWLSAGPGNGAARLALQAASAAAAAGGVVVVIDWQRRFYPPAAVAAGLDLARTLWVRPDDAASAAWAFDQALRCPGVAAVFGEVDALDDRMFRRWQLAAEMGGALGALVRPAQARREPSWAECRWWVEPLATPCKGPPPAAARPPDGRWRRWRVELLRGRGVQPGQAAVVELGGVSEWDRARECSPDRPAATRNFTHETPAVHLASQLAVATAARRTARA